MQDAALFRIAASWISDDAHHRYYSFPEHVFLRYYYYEEDSLEGPTHASARNHMEVKEAAEKPASSVVQDH